MLKLQKKKLIQIKDAEMQNQGFLANLAKGKKEDHGKTAWLIVFYSLGKCLWNIHTD